MTQQPTPPSEPTQPIRHEDEEQDFEAIAGRGADIRVMVQTRGWQELYAPYLTNRVDQLRVEFLTKDHTYEEFVRIQKEWLACQFMLDRAVAFIRDGENAAEQLAEKRKNEKR